MLTRRLLSVAAIASSLLIAATSPASAAAHASVSPTNELTIRAQKVVDGAQAAAKGSGRMKASSLSSSGADTANDAVPMADVTNTAIAFDTSRISVTTTLAQPVNLSDRLWTSGDYALAIQLSFNKSEKADALMFLGTDGYGPVVAVGENQYGGHCALDSSIAGNKITLTGDASCFYRPGSIAYSVIYGNFTKAYSGDYSELDMAPDMGFTNSVGQAGGYWLLGQDGGVFAFGDAAFYGSTGNLKLNQPVVGMAAMPDGLGYRFVAKDGGIFTYGSAGFYGSTGSMKLNQPIVGMATTPSGKGYWLVGRDGGIFSFGDAKFFGSTGGLKLNQPIVGMTATETGKGYWLVASDGGIFAFGDAKFYGSTGGMKLNQPITALGVTANGRGYYLLAKDGGVFAFGDATFHGSGAGEVFGSASAISVNEGGYRITDTTGGVWEYGAAYHYGDLVDLDVWPNSPIIGAAELPH